MKTLFCPRQSFKNFIFFALFSQIAPKYASKSSLVAVTDWQCCKLNFSKKKINTINLNETFIEEFLVRLEGS